MLALLLLLALSPCIPQYFATPKLDEVHWIVAPVDATLETPHYLLYMEGTAMEAERRGALVEAAWSGYKAFLKGAPKQRAGQKTILRIFPNREAWRASLDLEQEIPPGHALHLHYSPDRRTVYLYEDGTTYLTDKWLLHGTFLDFHRHLKSKNRDLANEWYVSGMADTFSTHSWRNGALELGTRRVLNHNNRALAATERGVLLHIEDGEISKADLCNWEVRWAMTSFMIYGKDGAYLKKFERLALGSRGSMLFGHDFLPTVGEPQQITAEILAWIKDQARVLEVTKDGNWMEDGLGLTGTAAGARRPGLASPAEEANFLEATFGVNHVNEHGLLIDWLDGSHFTIAFLRDDHLILEQRNKSKTAILRELAIDRDPQGRCKMSLERDGHEVILRAAGARPLRLPVKSRKFGLAVGLQESRFEDIYWR